MRPLQEILVNRLSHRVQLDHVHYNKTIKIYTKHNEIIPQFGQSKRNDRSGKGLLALSDGSSETRFAMILTPDHWIEIIIHYALPAFTDNVCLKVAPN